MGESGKGIVSAGKGIGSRKDVSEGKGMGSGYDGDPLPEGDSG